MTRPQRGGNNTVMVAFLEGQIEFLGKQVEAFPRGAATAELRENLDEAVSLALHYFDILRSDVEKALPPNDWREEVARQFIPHYQRWYEMGKKTLAFIREAKALGVVPKDIEPFMHAYLEAKSAAEDFDKNLEISRRIARGESQGRPLQELIDELLRDSRAAG